MLKQNKGIQFETLEDIKIKILNMNCMTAETIDFEKSWNHLKFHLVKFSQFYINQDSKADDKILNTLYFVLESIETFEKIHLLPHNNEK